MGEAVESVSVCFEAGGDWADPWINGETVSKVLEREGVPRRGRPLSPRRSSKPHSCTPLGCRWSALASGSSATVVPFTLPSGRLVYGSATSTERSARQLGSYCPFRE